MRPRAMYAMRGRHRMIAAPASMRALVCAEPKAAGKVDTVHLPDRPATVQTAHIKNPSSILQSISVDHKNFSFNA